MSSVTTFQNQGQAMLCWLQDKFEALDEESIGYGCDLCLSEQIEQGIRFFRQSLETAEQREHLTHSHGLSLLGIGAAHLCREEVFKTLDYYERAEDVFLSIGDSFAVALSRWGLGCIEWAQGNHADALKYLEESSKALDQDPYDQRTKDLHDEVSSLRREVKRSIAEAKVPLRSERPEIELMAIIGSIPASAPFNVSRCRISEISTREILVDGEPHYVQTIGASSDDPFGFASKEVYFSLQVIGSSMQDADIDDEDYVLIRRDAEPPAGRIVAARIGHECTVKRYDPHHESGYVWLQPEDDTTKPIVVALTRAGAAFIGHKYDEEEVTLVESPIRFDILGEAVAVLKKLLP